MGPAPADFESGMHYSAFSPRLHEPAEVNDAGTDAFLDSLGRALRAGALESAPRIAASHQGEIFRLRHRDRTVAVKTAAGRGPVGAANRLALTREYRAYRRLAGVPGIAVCDGLIDGCWLVLEHVRGRPFRDAEVGEEFFDRLLETLREMHRRGVAHADLKRKANLLVADGDRPVVLDFGAAVLFRPGLHPLNHRLFAFMRQTDLNAWVKLKYGGYDGVAGSDRALLKRSWIERALASLRRG